MYRPTLYLPRDLLAWAEGSEGRAFLRRRGLDNIRTAPLFIERILVPDLSDHMNQMVLSGQIQSFVPMRLTMAEAQVALVLEVCGDFFHAMETCERFAGRLVDFGEETRPQHSHWPQHRILTLRVGGAQPDVGGVLLHVPLSRLRDQGPGLLREFRAQLGEVLGLFQDHWLGSLAGLAILSQIQEETIHVYCPEGSLLPYSPESGRRL